MIEDLVTSVAKEKVLPSDKGGKLTHNLRNGESEGWNKYMHSANKRNW